MNFEERLTLVLNDRKKTPWGTSLGFTSTSISSMFNGHVPGPEFLQAIRKAENVNLNWLLTAQGTPFVIENYHDSFVLNDAVCELIKDEAWQVAICSHQDTAIVIMHLPAQYNFKGKWIDYEELEILVGPLSEQLIETCTRYQIKMGGGVYIPEISDDLKNDIMSGHYGTYLIGNCISPVGQQTDLSELRFSLPEPKQSAVSLPLMREVVRLIEKCEKELYERLTPDQKARVITAVYRQAERLKLTADDLTPDSVLTAFDVVRD
ncbi:hypothetical protein [Vibrio sp. ER1A]|uniref:hypothetical protein n=1 Tax=Vibrio sp. ER1A TaxID=1517681 RepID=UPI0004DCBEB0|nr:hypothetical protein [Vibrio sp. ER1A]KFA98767.1 hypothetical protein HW45_07005 [Vibrio sp. ER1A]